MNLKTQSLGNSYRTIRSISEACTTLLFDHKTIPNRLIVGNKEAEDLITTNLTHHRDGIICFNEIPLVILDEPCYLAVEDSEGLHIEFANRD